LKLLPIQLLFLPPDSGLNASWISESGFGTDAHSGATVADFNRVPIYLSQSKKHFGTCGQAKSFFKEQSINYLTQHLADFKRKIKIFTVSDK